MMRRRTFLAAAASIPLLAPRARAQGVGRAFHIAMASPTVPLGQMTESGGNESYRRLFAGLRAAGLVEGQALRITRISALGAGDQYEAVGRILARSEADLIFIGNSSPMTVAAAAATQTTPIVFVLVDPVGDGVVTNIARPGGNVTGAATAGTSEIEGKRLGILHEAVPNANRIGYVTSQTAWPLPRGDSVREAAKQLGIELVPLIVDAPLDDAAHRRVLESPIARGIQALQSGQYSGSASSLPLVARFASENGLPAIASSRSFVTSGGMMYYGTDGAEGFERVVEHIVRILNGAKAGDLPVSNPTAFDLIINLRAAKALGVSIPLGLTYQATEFIE